MSTEASLTSIAICQLIATAAIIVLAVGLLYAVFAFKKMVSNKVDQVLAEVKPVAEQARLIAEQAKRTADTTSEKIDSMMTAAEDAVTGVGDAVRNVSRRIDEAVNPEVARLTAIACAVAKCVAAWRAASASSTSKFDEQSPSTAESSSTDE